MRLSRMLVVFVLGTIVAVTAATAGARINGAQKTTTITFWNAYSSDGPEVKRLEKVHPAVPEDPSRDRRQGRRDPYDSLHQKLVTGIAGGQLPDLVRSDIIWVPELANLGVLEPLDKTLPDFKKLTSTVFAGPLATNYWKGHYYGLPLDTNTRTGTTARLRSRRPVSAARRRRSRS
jgi:ABC-type sugar transport system, periplasmic component